MTELVKPLYTIFQYGDTGVYKIIKFKHRENEKMRIEVEDDDEQKQNDSKLANNLARAKSTVLQLALCNPWDYFVTFTLDKEKYNRYDLEKFKADLSQWIRNERRKYKTPIEFIYIPERHKDGAWHAHGLMHGVHDDMLADFVRGVHPYSLIKKGYKRIPEYEKKFGFISLGKIKDNTATAFYITKYITKTMAKSNFDLGVHTYYASKNLNRAVLACDIYYHVPEFDSAHWCDGDFCSVATVQKKRWDFGLEYAEFSDFEQMKDLDRDDMVVDYDERIKFRNQPYTEEFLDGFFDILRDLHFCDRSTGECVGMAGP